MYNFQDQYGHYEDFQDHKSQRLPAKHHNNAIEPKEYGAAPPSSNVKYVPVVVKKKKKKRE